MQGIKGVRHGDHDRSALETATHRSWPRAVVDAWKDGLRRLEGRSSRQVTLPEIAATMDG